MRSAVPFMICQFSTKVVILRKHQVFLSERIANFQFSLVQEQKNCRCGLLSVQEQENSLVCRDGWKMSMKWMTYRCISECLHMETEEVGIKTWSSAFKKCGRTEEDSWCQRWQKVENLSNYVAFVKFWDFTDTVSRGLLTVLHRGAASVAIVTYAWEITELKIPVVSCSDTW